MARYSLNHLDLLNKIAESPPRSFQLRGIFLSKSIDSKNQRIIIIVH